MRRDMIKGNPKWLEEIMALVRESERIWERVNWEKFRNSKGAQRQSDITRAWGRIQTHKEYTEDWEKEADRGRTEWSTRHGFYQPTQGRYGLVFWRCGYEDYISKDCQKSWGCYSMGKVREMQKEGP